MCGICKGHYFFCDVCKDIVDYIKPAKANFYNCEREVLENDDTFMCGGIICNDCHEKGFIYCDSCINYDKILIVMLEKAKNEVDKIVNLIKIHENMESVQ